MANELNFTKPEELQEWLKDKPVEWAQVIAVRTALRVLPLVGQLYHADFVSSKDKDDLALLTHRACLISSVARKYPAEDMAVVARAAADYYAPNIGTYAVVDAATYAVVSAAVTRAPYTADYTAAHAVDYATRAAGNVTKGVNAYATAHIADVTTYVDRAADAATADIWITVSQDINWLVAHEGSAEERARQLWPGGQPDWVLDELRQLTNSLIGRSPYHQVWINWYIDLLHDKPFFGLSAGREKALTLKIAQQENNFWEQDFAKVSEDISEWLAEVRIWDAGDAEQRRLDEEQDASIESVSTVGMTPNPKTKPSIQLVDQNLLQVCTNIEAIKSISSERLEAMPLKPNSGEALEDWNKQREILTIMVENSVAISVSLQAIEEHNDRSRAIAETTSLLDELFQEFELFVRTNKKELVDNIVRIPSAILLCGLANLVGASMITASPAIFAMVGGKKLYDLLPKKNGKSDK